MRILFVSSTYYPHINGVYYFVCRIGQLLQQSGHQVTVMAPSASSSFTLQKIDDIDVYGIPSLPSLLHKSVRIALPLLAHNKIKKVIDTVRPDVIHIQDHFPLSKATLSIARQYKIPVVATNHFMPENLTVFMKTDYLKRKLEGFLWKGFSRAFNQTNVVTTPTETGVRLIQQKLSVKAIAISSGIDLDSFKCDTDAQAVRQKYGIPDKPVLLYVGRLDPEKNIEEILQAVALCCNKSDFCCVIVGRGVSGAALQKLATGLNIQGGVVFTGFVPDEDLTTLYKLSQCFIIASVAELLSLGTLQAMAASLPVIAVNVGALPELVKSGQNGYLFESGDIDAIARYIETIIQDKGLQQRMGAKSIELAGKHDIHHTLQSFEALYRLQLAKCS